MGDFSLLICLNELKSLHWSFKRIWMDPKNLYQKDLSSSAKPFNSALMIYAQYRGVIWQTEKTEHPGMKVHKPVWYILDAQRLSFQMYLFQFMWGFLKNSDSLISARLPKENIHTTFLKETLSWISPFIPVNTTFPTLGLSAKMRYLKYMLFFSGYKSLSHFSPKRVKENKEQVRYSA